MATATIAGGPAGAPFEAGEALAAALAAGKLHHAYLFEGPVGAGKRRAALALAQRLQCEAPPGAAAVGCGRCDPCRKVADGSHPDVLWRDMTAKGLTERMRELLLVLAFRPYEGSARVVVFDPAEALAPAPERAEAANVLLKSLEEPPPDTYFLLLTAEPRRLPITIRSRCQRLRFQGGDPDALCDDERRLRRDEAWRALEALFADERPSASRLFATTQALGGEREELLPLVGSLWRGLRAALLAGHRLDEGRTSAEERALARPFGGWSATALLGGLQACNETRDALRGNVAPALALERLLLELTPVGR